MASMLRSRLFLTAAFVLQVILLAAARELQQAGSINQAASSRGLAVDQTQFFPPQCERFCNSGSDFHIPLPTVPNVVSGNVASQWATAMLVQVRQAVRAGTTSPPLVAHTLAVYSTAVYDAVAVLSRGDMRPVHATPDARQPNAAVSKSGVEAAIAGAAYTAIGALLGLPQDSSLDTLLAQIGTSPRSKAAYATGVAAASQVLAVRASDGFTAPTVPSDFRNPAMTSTVVTDCANTNINFWQRLKVPAVKAFTPAVNAIFPPAGYNSVTSKTQGFLAYAAAFAKPFSAATVDDLVGNTLPGPNYLTGTPVQAENFKAEINEVLSLSASLDDVNKTIANVWADGPDTTTPPGHWYQIALEQSQLQGLKLHKTVVLLLAVGNALQDAGIAAWHAKARWSSSRPITALQCMYQGQQVTAWKGPYLGVGSRDGSTWQPYQATTFVTPPFPGYVSGHSTFSAAAARVLTRFFGNGKFKGARCYRAEAGSSLIEPKITDPSQAGYVAGFTDVPSENGGPGYAPGRPVVLCWDSFQEASVQAGRSRLYGGIHVAKDDCDGQLMGDIIGNMVMDIVDRYTPGTL